MKKGDIIKWVQHNGNILTTQIVRVNRLSYTCRVLSGSNYSGTVKVFKDWVSEVNGEKVVIVSAS